MSEPKPCHSIGIQWGFWYWSEKEYKWIGGTGGAPPPPEEEYLIDDFNDNSRNVALWDLYSEAGGVASEETQLLLCNKNPSVGHVSGYRSVTSWIFQSGYYASVTVADKPTDTGAGLVLDKDATNIYIIVFLLNGKVRFSKVINNVPTTIAESVGSVYVANAKLKLLLTGTTLHAYYDIGAGWVELGSGDTYAFLTNAVKIRIYGHAESVASSQKLDNFDSNLPLT